MFGSPDPYVQVSVDGRPQSGTLRTPVASGSAPVWNHTFEDELEYQNEDHINFVVYDEDSSFDLITFTDDEIGRATLQRELFLPGGYNGGVQLDGAENDAQLWVAVEVNNATATNEVDDDVDWGLGELLDDLNDAVTVINKTAATNVDDEDE